MSPYSLCGTPTPSRSSRPADLLEGSWASRKGNFLARGLSSPDLRAPLKLAPLPPSTPGTPAKRRSYDELQGSTRKNRHSTPKNDDREKISTAFEEASWAAATLSSLSPQVQPSPRHGISEPTDSTLCEEAHALAVALNARGNATVNVSFSQNENRLMDTNQAAAWRSVDPVDAFSSLDGGPSVEEALARLNSGSEGLPEAELLRMNIAFCRHKEADSSEVQKEDLHRIFHYLGYYFARQDKVEIVARKVSEFSSFDFQEFEHLTMDWCASEREEIIAAYSNFDAERTNQVPVHKIAKMLRPLGIIAVRSVVHDLLEVAQLSEHRHLDINDFFRFLAAYRAVEGFTRAQVAAARKVFEDAASSRQTGQAGNALKAQKKVLANCLLTAYGEHVVPYLADLFQGIYLDHSQKGAGISFHEFMVWGRKLRDAQLKRLDIFFNDAKKDIQGLISVEELARMIKPAGFTLFSKAIDEILSDMNATRVSKFDFSDYVRFLKACQKKNGFTRFELEELASVFRRFDYDRSDGIDHLELLDLLRYLGYSTHLKDVHQFIGQVDFNGNGSMDFGEFLCLMRLHREDELSNTLKVYEECKDEDDAELLASDLADTLEKLGHTPRPEVLQMLLNKIGNPETISFEKFVEVVDHFRRMSTTEKRKRAGFSDEEFKLIVKLFEKHNTHKNTPLEKGELILLLIEAGIFMDTADARNEIFTMLEKARESAAEAGIETEELGKSGSSRCTFWPLVHLLRAVIHRDDKGAVRREDQAVDETRFEPTEVQDFRAIFLECSRWGQSTESEKELEQEQVPPPGASPAVPAHRRRASLPSTTSMSSTQPLNRSSISGTAPEPQQDTSNLTLKECLGGNPSGVRASVKGIQVVLFKHRMNMHLSADQRQELEHQVQMITGNQDGVIDFADFLRLMKWMLQTNFSKINEVAEKRALETSKQTEAERKVMTVKNVASAVVRLRSKGSVSLRRKSV